MNVPLENYYSFSSLKLKAMDLGVDTTFMAYLETLVQEGKLSQVHLNDTSSYNYAQELVDAGKEALTYALQQNKLNTFADFYQFVVERGIEVTFVDNLESEFLWAGIPLGDVQALIHNPTYIRQHYDAQTYLTNVHRSCQRALAQTIAQHLQKLLLTCTTAFLAGYSAIDDDVCMRIEHYMQRAFTFNNEGCIRMMATEQFEEA